MNINSVSKQSNLSLVYIRRAIKNNTLKASLVPVSPTSTIMRYDITEEDLNAFINRGNKHNKREDGRNRYVAHLNDAEYAKIIEKFPELKDLIVRQNPQKSGSKSEPNS